MDSTQHRPTLRVLEVLDLLSQSKEGYALSEISTILQIPKGSLFPIVHTLRSKHYIRIDEGLGKYMIGIKSYELGNSYMEQVNVLNEIKQLVIRVVSYCNETCHFAVREGKDVIYLLKEESAEPIRMVSSIGKRLSAHSTAIGKALLSGCEEYEIKEFYYDGLPKVTPRTIVDIDELCRQVELVKKEKLAYETEESSLNVTCIAVPIEKDGKVVAAMSVSIPIFRSDEEKMDKIKVILLQTKELTEKLLAKVPFRI